LGESLASCGRIGEGLGLCMDLQRYCREDRDTYALGHVILIVADILLQIGRPDDALRHLAEAKATFLTQVDIRREFAFHRFLAAAQAQKAEYGKAAEHIKDAAALGLQNSFSLFVCEDELMRMAVELGEDAVSALSGYTPEQTIELSIKGNNVFTRGMGYLFKARLLIKRGESQKEILRLLRLSIKWLDKSGNEIQLAKARFELSRIYLELGHRDKAKSAVAEAGKVLNPIYPSLIPDDLASLFEPQPFKMSFADEISSLSQEIMTIRNERDLVQRMLSAINQLTGAERGAVFTVGNHSDNASLEIKATRFLTEDQIADPSFTPAKDAIRETIADGKSRIVKMDPAEATGALIAGFHDTISSCFCLPMVLKGKIVGALYHDNRIFDCSVEETDLDTLGFLAGQAAIALDNARAYEEIRQLNQQLLDEKQYYVERDTEQHQPDNIVGKSPAMLRVFDEVNRVAGQDTAVLIQGETGVGKELIARAIQKASNRKEKPFICADCSTLSEGLIASELFGHEKGAFTGATAQEAGRFELANGGTLFLDEIGNIPMDVQVRLLRVLQTGEFQRVGGVKTIDADFRLITATNRSLSDEVVSGRFREDLYYRLDVFTINVPPLRERRDDIPLLALYFLRMYSERMGKPFESISKTEMSKLLEYPWPGNVRELQNTIEKGVILCDSPHFRVPEFSNIQTRSSEADVITLAENERRYILRILEMTGGKVSGKNGAAQYLGVPHTTLYSKMKKLGIEKGRTRAGSVL
jgi:formate hydrogenlyase transcriptional activator